MPSSQSLSTIIVAVTLGVAGCSTVCDRESLPNKGDASTPENLVSLVLYACQNHCWRVLYDHASEKTRAKYSYVEFRIGFPDMKAPGSEEKIVDLVASSSLDVVSHWHWGERYRLAILSHKTGDESQDLNVVLVQEQDEDGNAEWHVALAEQMDRKVPFD
jgi:hypothetical protein